MSDDDRSELTARQVEDIQTRFAIAQAMGESFNGERSLYDTLGWEEQPTAEDFWAMYLRNPYGKAVVDMPAETAWRDAPDIEDKADTGPDDQTEFESDLDTFTDALRVWHYCKRADKLAGIGEYGLLLIGFADDGRWIDPVEASNLADDPTEAIDYLRPFSQLSVDTIRLGGPDSARWGRPLYYQIDLGDVTDQPGLAENVYDDSDTEGSLWVHHSRVIHIAEGKLDDEVRGTPRLEPVYNALTDIQKALGAAAEAAYRGADKGLHVNVDSDQRFDDEDKEQVEEDLTKWYHDLQPFLRTQGAEIEELGGADIDPQPIIDAEVEQISAQTGIPQSILKGNETGERATTEDRKGWHAKAAERREQFLTPAFVRELLDRLVSFGVISEPDGDGYEVEWPALSEPSAADEADVHLARSKVANNLSKVAPSVTSAQWVEYIEEGTIPDEAEVDIEPMDVPDAPDEPDVPGVSDEDEDTPAADESTDEAEASVADELQRWAATGDD